MRSFISHYFVTLAGAIVIALVPVSASAATPAHAAVATHISAPSAIRHMENVPWD